MAIVEAASKKDKLSQITENVLDGKTKVNGHHAAVVRW